MIPNKNNPHDRFTREDITHGFSKVFTINNAISEETAADLLRHGSTNVTPANNKHNFPFSIQVDTCFLPLDHPVHTELQTAWQQAMNFYNFHIDFIEPYEIKYYPLGGHYSRHIDNYHGMNIPTDRKISMILQLSEDSDYAGGNLTIVREQASRKRLSMTFFPSFYPHGVDTITRGSRWVLIGWAWGPYWR
jgi:predicted 2-oxoglutarate/Fe(II)-dependent dioxygenase YbiX